MKRMSCCCSRAPSSLAGTGVALRASLVHRGLRQHQAGRGRRGRQGVRLAQSAFVRADRRHQQGRQAETWSLEWGSSSQLSAAKYPVTRTTIKAGDKIIAGGEPQARPGGQGPASVQHQASGRRLDVGRHCRLVPTPRTRHVRVDARCARRRSSHRLGPARWRRRDRRHPRLAAPSVAPKDLTGTWVSVVAEHWHLRMLVPPKGEFAMLPLNPEARGSPAPGIPRRSPPAMSSAKAMAPRRSCASRDASTSPGRTTTRSGWTSTPARRRACSTSAAAPPPRRPGAERGRATRRRMGGHSRCGVAKPHGRWRRRRTRRSARDHDPHAAGLPAQERRALQRERTRRRALRSLHRAERRRLARRRQHRHRPDLL